MIYDAGALRFLPFFRASVDPLDFAWPFDNLVLEDFKGA